MFILTPDLLNISIEFYINLQIRLLSWRCNFAPWGFFLVSDSFGFSGGFLIFFYNSHDFLEYIFSAMIVFMCILQYFTRGWFFWVLGGHGGLFSKKITFLLLFDKLSSCLIYLGHTSRSLRLLLEIPATGALRRALIFFNHHFLLIAFHRNLVLETFLSIEKP